MERYSIKNQPSLVELPMPDTTLIERQVLADATSQPTYLPEYVSIITPDMFSTQARADAWSSILDLYNSGETIDLISVRSKVGRDTFINEINSVSPDGFNGVSHALLLRDASTKRRAYQAALQVIYKACDPKETETGILAELETASQSVAANTLRPDESAIPVVINQIADDLDNWKKKTESGKRTRIPTGFFDLDNVTNQGWAEGQLIILAARPSVGKTAIMLQFAKVAAENGFHAGIFTLEMTKKELVSRLLFSTGKISPAQFYDGSVRWEDFEQAAGQITNLPIYINDKANRLSEIVSRMHFLHNQGKCDIAFIDYLGLFRNENPRAPLYQVIAENTGTLKETAKRLGIPIVLLCQLNRDAAKTNREPELYDLRDSGSIEQDADIVLMLEQVEDQNQDPNKPFDIKLWIRKNRQGKKDLHLVIEPDRTYTSFTEKDFRL